MSKSKITPVRQNILNLFPGFDWLTIEEMEKKYQEKYGEPLDGKNLTWLRENGLVMIDNQGPRKYRKRTNLEVQEFLTANF